MSFLDWILRLHPAIEQRVAVSFNATDEVSVSPRAGGSASGLVESARDGRSDWDVLVGVTPFLDTARLVEAEAIVPWDDYVPAEVLRDLHPAVRRESTFAGKLYSFPFLVDVVVQGWNTEIVERAGLDPGRPPTTWDELIAGARTIQATGAAPYGCTFDARSRLSLLPITYTLDTDVYTEDGLFDYTHDAAVEALEVMRRMLELANPDVLDPTTTAGSGATTDEGVFASQLAGYYVKYANALVRAANTWPDPTALALSRVPISDTEVGATVFFTTGAALPKYGARRPAAARFMQALVYDRRLWRDSIGAGRQSVGQLPACRSLWNDWRREEQAWVPRWASRTFGELANGAPIRPHRLGARQFSIAQPYLDRYLMRDERDARKASRDALAAVRREA